MNRKMKFVTGMMLVLCLCAAGTSVCAAADAAKPPARIAVLPFSMHTPSNLAYLQDGILDMLMSRLAWQGKVQVVDRATVQQAVRSAKGDMSSEEAIRIGKATRADYVLYGSVTAIGQSISLDAKMLPLSGNAEPTSLVAQTKSLDDVIPKINQFAQNINQKIFGRPVEQAQAGAGSDEQLAATRNPELLIPDTMVSGDKISYLNPNFVEVTPEGSLRQPGLWRSQTFRGGLLGLDVGDLDGDGQPELVTILDQKVTVYHKEVSALRPIATYEGSRVDRFMWVSVVDVNRDGRAEIYVTNMRTRNMTTPSASESIKGDAGYTSGLASLALTLVNGKLQVLCDRIPYFLNGVELPGRGKVLLGQQKGREIDGAFGHDINEMQLRGNSLAPSVPVNLPSRCNIYNFAKADINNDHSDEYLVIDSSNHLLVLNSSGEQIWKSDKLFAATTNGFEAKVEDRRFNSVEYYYIPSPIVVTDLNKDGIPEIIVDRSTDAFSKLMPEGLKYYDKGEIVSLSWDQLGLVENWKTREISGMVTSIRVADLDHNGLPELISSLVLAKDLLKLWDSKSTVFTYDLNVSPAPKTASK